ncbi:MAG: TonB-dependent receptor [Acidimicrobiia bacterium]|nr:TonB-dependent receptor [Acidimicrobiia bacterium]
MLKARCLLVGACLLLPALAHAQSAITGTVSDATGSVLPGVTVEAASPALIEGARVGVTDGQGRYRVVDLRPGTYTVTFTLPGFTTVRREGIDLASNFTATVDAQLTVGAVEETVVVSGAAPVVDVQATSRREVITSEMVEQLPNGRSITMVGALMPALAEGAQNKDVGGIRGMQQTATPLTAYGSRDMTLEIDGLPVTVPIGSGLPGVYYDVGAFEDFVYQVSGSTSEGQTGGVRLNMISKTGSNTFNGRGLWIWSAPSLYTNNIGPDLVARGISNPPELVRMRDFNADLGGPVLTDRLWFYVSARAWDVDNAVNMLHDGRLAPAGEQVVDDNSLQSYMLRLTYQATGRDKVTAMYTRHPRQRKLNGIENLTNRPEAAQDYVTPRSYISTLKWTSTLTNALLIEAGFAPISHIVRALPQEGQRTAAELPPYGDIRRCDVGINRCWNAVSARSDFGSEKQSAVASVTYVTGAHALKVGYQYAFSSNWVTRETTADGVQVYNRGVPFAFDAANTPIVGATTNVHEHALYAQDTWTLDRLTLNPGIRWDRFIGTIPEQTFGGGRFTTPRRFAAIDGQPDWKDTAPRFGASYDVRGDGRTAVKGSVGRYLLMQSVGFPAQFNPANPGGVFDPVYDRRNWTDLNGDDIAQDHEIGPSRNPTFSRADRNPDPDLKREYDVLYNVSVDHQVMRAVGLAVSFNRRHASNLNWIDNVAQSPSDYEMLTAPDPRDPASRLPVWQVIPGRLAPAVREIIRNSDDNTRVYTGVDALLSARFDNGALLSGGISSGRLVLQNCERENPNSNDSQFCDQSAFDVPFRTTVKVAGSYPLPWYGLRVSGTFQRIPGNERVHTYVVTRAQVPALSTASSVLVRLNEPGSLYFDYINQVDVSFRGTLRVGGVRVTPTLDVYNVLNANPILTELGRFPTADVPRTLLAGRLVRFGIEVPFGR